MSSKLGFVNDRKFRSALRRDDKQIAALVVSVLDSESEEGAVLRLEGDSAQDLLDVFQHVRIFSISELLN